MRDRRVVLHLVLVLAALTCAQGCNKAPEPPMAFESGLTPPMAESDLSLPTPASGLAVVAGVLVEAHSQAAPVEGVVYLGQIARLDGDQPVVSLDRDAAPFAIPAHDGRFIFQGVEPGEYGLVFYTPDVSFLVDSPEGAKSLIFEVGPDEVLHLGKIEVQIP